MSPLDDRDKLRLLLPHWIEHNAEHASEFRRWAEKAGPARTDILSAADDLMKVNQTLTRALEKLGGPLEHPKDHEG
ncbi:MAG: hypothetical protein H5T63_06770 [Chloroflexi bacterium]|nr:hypothetical protein [Chloroflexota bacterium]